MRRDKERACRRRWQRILACIVACIAAAPVAAQQFRGGSGLSALTQGATGIYELGWLRLGSTDIVVEALLHNGAILQVHSRKGPYWLAKRAGSRGGKEIAPTKFDELTQVAGGLNRNVGLAANDVQADFARTGDLFWLPVEAKATSPMNGPTVVPAGSRVAPSPSIATERCQPPACRVIYPVAAGTPDAFRISVNDGEAVWSFEGFGIVAIWGLPH